MLTAEQRETIRRARDEQARERAKRTARVEDQLERDFAGLKNGARRPVVPRRVPLPSREEVIDAMQRWLRDHGQRPKSSEWQAAKNGYDRPSYDTVIRVFGSWPAALEAAYTSRTKLVPEPIPEPPPALPEPPVDPVGENSSLAELAEELEAANEDRELAQARFDAALERFREHPLVADLV